MDEEALQRRLLDMTVCSSGEGIQEIANKYRYTKVVYKKINLPQRNMVYRHSRSIKLKPIHFSTDA
jgi:predicted nucleic acid-binding protein